MAWFLVFFFVSGFCSILYEIVWLRLAMAQFGVTSAMVSVVLSMFMAGLGLGSWGSGYLIQRYELRINFPALRLYALAELLIGVSAILVPYELTLGRSLLARVPLSSSWSYYLASGTWVALTLIPWCACMGATIPVAMLAIREKFPRRRPIIQLPVSGKCLWRCSGCCGATAFNRDLRISRRAESRLCVENILLAISATGLTLRPAQRAQVSGTQSALPAPLQPSGKDKDDKDKGALVLLFATGCTSMGIEVVWIRQFTPFLGTVVYAFAAILSLYLMATFIGSRIYRRRSSDHAPEGGLLWVLLGACALSPR